MWAWALLATPRENSKARLPESNSAIQMMENPLFPLKSDPATWLSPWASTWVRDVLLAIACGMVAFFLLLPYLQGHLPPPPLGKKKKIRQHQVRKRGHRNMRKKSGALKACRIRQKEVEEMQDLVSLVQSCLGRLQNSSSFFQLLKGDASGKMFKPASAGAHQPPRQPVEDACAPTLSPVASAPPLAECPLPLASILSLSLMTLPVPVGSHSFVRTPQAPQPLTPLQCRSSQAQALCSLPSPPPDPVACPPSVPDASLDLPQGDSVSVPPGATPQGFPPLSTCQLPPPVPVILDLGHSSCPPSAPSQWPLASTASCLCGASHREPQGNGLPHHPPEASLLTGATGRQREVGTPSFISPDTQTLLEMLISKRAKLEVCKDRGEEGLNDALGSPESVLKSLGGEQGAATPCPLWDATGKPQQLPSSPRALGDHVQQKCSQLFWGLPFLYSESLGVTSGMSGTPQDCPSILFNGLSKSVPVQVQDNIPPQLHPLIQLQPLTAARSGPPLADEIQTEARLDPDQWPPPIPPCHSPLIKACGVSCPTTQKTAPFPVSPTTPHLEHHFLKKHLERRIDLSSVVKKSKEIFSQITSKSWASQDQKSVVSLSGDLISPELREQLEQHLQKRFTERQGELPLKTQLSLDLAESQDKFPGRSQAEGKLGPSWTSVLAEESSQEMQKMAPGDQETFQIGKNSGKDGGHYLEVLKDVYRSPEDSAVEVPEAISGTGSERDPVRCLGEPGTASLVGPGKECVGDVREAHPGRTWGQISEDGTPVSSCHSGLLMGRALSPPEVTNTDKETGNDTALEGQRTCGATAQVQSLLHSSIWQVLESHFQKFRVRHRWALPLKVLKLINLLTVKKTPAGPQPASPSLPSWVPRADSIAKRPHFPGEPPQKSPAEEVMATPAVCPVQNPPPAPSPKSLREPPSAHHCQPSEAPLPGKEGTYSLLGRTWHSDVDLRSWGGSPEPTPSPGTGRQEPQGAEGVPSRAPYHSVSVLEVSATSQSSRDQDCMEMTEAEEAECSEWAVTMETSVMANSQKIPGSVRSSDSLESGESPCASRMAALNAGDPGPNAQAEAGVVLHGLVAGVLLPDCAPERLLATDILASQASTSSFQSRSSSSLSTSQGLCLLSAREGGSPQTPMLRDLWHSTRPCPAEEREACGGARAAEQELWPAGVTHFHGWGLSPPAQVREVCRVRTKSCPHLPGKGQAPAKRHMGNRIRNFLRSIFPNKGQRQANPLPKAKLSLAAPQRRGAATGRFLHHRDADEAQALVTRLGWILEEKMRFYHELPSSKEKLPKVEPRAPTGRCACHCRKSWSPKQRVMSNMASGRQDSSKSHTHPSGDRRTRHRDGHQAVLPGDHAPPARPCQHRPSWVGVPGCSVHCPKHCLFWRAVLSCQPHHVCHICSGRKTLPQEKS